MFKGLWVRFEDQKLVFKTHYHLMQVKSIAECSKGSILQYFRPSLSYHLSLGAFLSIFEWPLKTGFTVYPNPCYKVNEMCYKGTVLYQEKNMWKGVHSILQFFM